MEESDFESDYEDEMYFEDGEIVEWKNDGQRNRLKGMGLERAVALFKRGLSDQSIKTIIQEMINNQQVPELFIVRKNFRINNKEYKRGVSIFLENIEEGKIKSIFKIKDKRLKVCSNEVCFFHQQSKLYTKNERKCNKCSCKLDIYYFIMKSEEVIFEGIKSDIFKFLIDGEYIKKIDVLKRRIDHFEFYNDEIFVLESKNHIMLSPTAVRSSEIYPMVLKLYSNYTKKDCKKMTIIQKGDVSPMVYDYIDNTNKMHNYEIEIKNIDEYIAENVTEKGFLSAIILDYKNKKEGYSHEFEYSNEPKTFKIKFRNINPDVKEFHFTQEQVENAPDDSRLGIVEELDKLKEVDDAKQR